MTRRAPRVPWAARRVRATQAPGECDGDSERWRLLAWRTRPAAATGAAHSGRAAAGGARGEHERAAAVGLVAVGVVLGLEHEGRLAFAPGELALFRFGGSRTDRLKCT